MIPLRAERPVEEWAEYLGETGELVSLVQSMAVHAPGFQPGDATKALHNLMAGQIGGMLATAADANPHDCLEALTAEEARFLEWMAGWDPPMIAWFLTLLRRVWQAGMAVAS